MKLTPAVGHPEYPDVGLYTRVRQIRVSVSLGWPGPDGWHLSRWLLHWLRR